MTSLTVSANDVEFVSIDGGEPRTTTLAVAEKFGRRHSDVLRAVKNLDCSEDFAKRNFALCFKISESQNGKKQPYYSMTKDGFVFLVMGFTGKQAAEFKEWYINEFNRMAAMLNGEIGPLLHRYNIKTSTLKQDERIASDCGYGLWYLGRVKNPKTREELKELEEQLQPLLTGFDEAKLVEGE